MITLIKEDKYKILDDVNREVPIPPQPRIVTAGRLQKRLPDQYTYNEWVELYFNKLLKKGMK